MNRLFILSCLLVAGCASAPLPDPITAPLIVLEEEPDGEHWRATWHLTEPSRELLFERRAAGFRPGVFEVLTPGFSFEKRGEQDLLRTTGAPVTEISVRFPEYSEWLQKEYEFFQTFSDGSVAVYTGHLTARPVDGGAEEECDACYIRSFRFVAAPGTAVVVNGQVETSPVDWVDEHEQGNYVYFGSLEPVESRDMISIVDPALPDWLEVETTEALPRLFELYSERLGVRLPERPTILFSFEDSEQSGYSSGGGTLPGQIQLTVHGTGWDTPSDEAKLHLLHFLAHEAVHLWNGQVVNYPDSEDSWMHEGSADALAQRTLLELGLIDEQRFLEYQTTALNECCRGLDGSPLRNAGDRRAFHLYYTCGNVLALVTEQTIPEHDLFGFWRELIGHALASRQYDADDYAEVWRRLDGDEGAIGALVEFVESAGYSDRLEGMLRRSGVAIVEDDDPPQTYGQSVSRDGFFLLMSENCTGSYGFNSGPDGFVVSDGVSCGPLPPGGVVTTLAGADVLREGHRAWDAMRDLCSEGEPVEVGVRTGGEVRKITLACPAAMPRRPPYLRIVDRGRAGSQGERDLEAIAAQSAALSDAYVRGDIDALVDVYSAGGIAIPGGRDAVRGHDDLRKLWALPEGRTILRHSANPVEIRIDGDLAYDWGYYEGQAAQNGKPLEPFRGIYTIVWTRGPDGVWRIAVDMWHGLK